MNTTRILALSAIVMMTITSLSACSEEKDKGVTKIETSNNSEATKAKETKPKAITEEKETKPTVITEEKDETEVSDEAPSSTDSTEVNKEHSTSNSNKVSVNDPNVGMKNGIAHYHLPNIETLDFGMTFCMNQFTINGYKVGDEAGDLIENLGEPAEVKSGRSGSKTYVYDNFEVSIKDDKVFSYIMQPTGQHPMFATLAKQWDSSPAFEDEHHMRLDNNKTNGFYVEVYDNGEGLVNGIGIFGENYKGE